VDVHRWVLLADAHIAADTARKERGVNMTAHLRVVTDQLLSLRQAPAGAILAGDCAFNTGESGDYRRLGGLLQPFRDRGIPLHLILGNHDHRERFESAVPGLANDPSPVSGKQVALVSTDRFNWLLLDSLDATNSTPGWLGTKQLEWLKSALDAYPAKPAIVVGHHNPGVDTSAPFNIAGIKDTEALFEVLRPRRQVKAYIYGHTHHWKRSTDTDGIHVVNLPPVAYVFRAGAPSGWVQADISDKGMRLTLRCVDPKHPADGEVWDLPWRS